MVSEIILNGKSAPTVAKKEMSSVLVGMGVYPSNVL
jgi:hypothetical protein